jgi:hypothetical protein
VLDNERTLEGDIERVGDRYRVRRSVGELWVPGENVLRLCANLEEAYRFLRGRANLRDADEHLRLANWCMCHGLRPQALAEVREAVELRPGHAASRRMLHNLERSANLTATVATHAPEEPEPAVSPPPVNSESLSQFVTRVQPTLMNACGNCHATGRGGAFKLTRAYEIGLGSRKITYQNLAATLAQVDVARVSASPLLQKAVSIHGDMAQPPFKNREAAAYRTLEDWVTKTIAENEELRERSGTVAQAPPAAHTVPVETTPAAFDNHAARPSTVKAVPAAATETQAKAPAPAAQAQDPAAPVDPFDPIIFNRQMHPKPAAPQHP